MESSETASQTLAFLGGTFDPPHWGHLLLAQDVFEAGGVDRVYFVPAARNPHKPQGPRADGADRLAMLRAAIGDDPRFGALDLEVRRPGPSYTIETVGALRERFPRASLAWIIGADQLTALPRWHAIERLVEEVEFLVLARPGAPIRAPALAGLRWRFASTRLIEIGATEIRARLAVGKPVDFFVPSLVLRHIQQHGLYLPL